MKILVNVVGAVVLTASTAGACPDFNQSGPGGNLSSQELRSGVAYQVTAGGDNYVWNCSNVTPGTEQGAGYFTTAPDFTFQLGSMGGQRLAVSVTSQCDSALLINTASGNWFYDDDDNGNSDARILLTHPIDGYLDIWVGTYDGKVCDAVLSLQTY